MTASTLRRWISAGAPVVTQGKRGPGCAARVDVAELRAWRRAREAAARDEAEPVDWRRHVENELQAFFALPELGGETAWQVFGLSERQATGVVVALAVRVLGPNLSHEFAQMRNRIAGVR